MDVANLDCPTPQSFTARVGGPQPDEDRTSLVFTPAFPCGVERSPALVAADDAPLRRIATPKFCVGRDDDPRHVLIRGTVWSFDSQRIGPGTINPLTLEDCSPNVARSQPRVKLEILSCAHDQSVIIDSDSAVVVPPGEISVNILVPGPTVANLALGRTGAAFGGWSYGPAVITDSTLWTDVTVRIDACPIDNYVPRGALSEWLRGVVDTTAVADQTLIRPRRARRLEISSIDSTTRAAATVQVDWLQDVTGTSATMGAFINPLNPVGTVEVVGAAQAIKTFAVPAAGRDIYVRWEIE